MTPSAVLFDCDGVLVDSEPITDRVIVANLASHGLSVTHQDVSDLFLGGTIRGVGETVRARGVPLPDDWAEQIYSDIYARLAEGCPLIDGVDGLLAALDARGIAYGVGSNGAREKMRVTLGQNGLWDRFEPAMVSSHDVPSPKPAPDVYLALAKILGVAPEDALVVDDSPSGVQAGLAAGIPTVGFCEHTPAARLERLGVPTVASMQELKRYILG